MRAALLLLLSLAAAGAADSPRDYRVRLDTTRGAIVIAVHRDWAPRGADRFHELVVSRYFDDSRFFRVVKGQWAQFGIAGDPAIATRWRTRTIADDPPAQSNVRGRVAFAFKDPGARTTQIYISLRDHSSRTRSGSCRSARWSRGWTSPMRSTANTGRTREAASVPGGNSRCSTAATPISIANIRVSIDCLRLR
jgi:cyclophilin family peptidyl-prolyl cis-trans isomerase